MPYLRVSLFCLFCIGLFATSCKKTFTDELIPPDGTQPFNPFDTITYPEDGGMDVEVDSASFLGLHTYIFSKRCAQPACHDGSFEPDFRTVQSSYSTLVLHQVKKNTPTNSYPYRVTPGAASQSMLFRRISVDDPPNLERMPAGGLAIPQREVDLIEQWINNGARDVYGNEPVQTSAQPSCLGVAAFLPGNNDFRIDTIRGGVVFQPFLAPANEDIDLWFLYLDATPAGDTILGNQLSYNKIKLSNNPFDFSNAVELNMNLHVFDFLMLASAFSEPLPFAVPYTQSVTFNPATLGFSAGETIYIRTYVKDSDHSSPTEIPSEGSQLYMQSYFSFILQ